MRNVAKFHIIYAICCMWLLISCSGGGTASSGNNNANVKNTISMVTPNIFYTTQVNNIGYVYIYNSESEIKHNLIYQVIAAQGSANSVSIDSNSAENCATLGAYSGCQLALNIPANLISGSFALRASNSSISKISQIIGIQQASANNIVAPDGISISYPSTIESGNQYVIVSGVVNSNLVGNFNSLSLLDNNGNSIPGLTVLSSNLGAGLSSLAQGSSFEVLMSVPDGSGLTQQFRLQTSMIDSNGESSDVQVGNASYSYTTESSSGIISALPGNIFLTSSNSQQQVTLVNNGSRDVQLTELAANSSNLETSFTPSSLIPGESVTITVTLKYGLTLPQSSSLVLNYTTNNNSHSQLINVYQNVAPFMSSTSNVSSTQTRSFKQKNASSKLNSGAASPSLQLMLWPSNQFFTTNGIGGHGSTARLLVITNNSGQRINNVNFTLPRDSYYTFALAIESGLSHPCTLNANHTGITDTLEANGGLCDIALWYHYRNGPAGFVPIGGDANIVANYNYIDGSVCAPVSQAVSYRTTATSPNIYVAPRTAYLSVVANGVSESSANFYLYNGGDAEATEVHANVFDNDNIIRNGANSCSYVNVAPGGRCQVTAVLGPFPPAYCNMGCGVNPAARINGGYVDPSRGARVERLIYSDLINGRVIPPPASMVQLSNPVVTGLVARQQNGMYNVEFGTQGASITYTLSNNSESTINNVYWDSNNYYPQSDWRLVNQCGTRNQPVSLAPGASCNLQFNFNPAAIPGRTTLEPRLWSILYMNSLGQQQYVVINQNRIDVIVVPRPSIASFAPAVVAQGTQFRIQLGLANGLGNYTDQNITAQLQSPTNTISINPSTCTLNSQNPQCSMYVTLASNAPAGSNIINLTNSGQISFDASTINFNVLEVPKTSFSKVVLEKHGACALAANNNTYCWGESAVIGNGIFRSENIPTLVNLPESVVNFTDIAIASGNTVCGVGNNGYIYCWGSNSFGQLGLGNYISNYTGLIPAQVVMPMLTKFNKILAVGATTFCALADSGKVYCWGNGSAGTIGNGSFNSANYVPTEVNMPYGVVFTDLTGSNGSVCAKGSNLKTYCWGANSNGQLASGYVTDVSIPTLIVGTTMAADFINFKELALQTPGSESPYTSCGISSVWGSYCWGAGDLGQLGNGKYYSSSYPQEVILGAGYYFKTLSVGSQFACSLGSDFKTRCWGLGTAGQLGNGGFLSESTPVVVSSPDGVIFASLNSSFNFSCAIGDDNNAYCWGDGVYGRLGNGTTQLSSTPTKVSFVAGAAVDKLILSGEYSCGILSNGKAYCWGRGGVLGTNTIQNDNNSTPLEVTMPIAN